MVGDRNQYRGIAYYALFTGLGEGASPHNPKNPAQLPHRPQRFGMGIDAQGDATPSASRRFSEISRGAQAARRANPGRMASDSAVGVSAAFGHRGGEVPTHRYANLARPPSATLGPGCRNLLARGGARFNYGRAGGTVYGVYPLLRGRRGGCRLRLRAMSLCAPIGTSTGGLWKVATRRVLYPAMRAGV